MCAIVGMLGGGSTRDQEILDYILAASKERGRDGFGEFWSESRTCYIANFRAEPTTEYVKDKQAHDQQPYQLGDWAIVHNGVIANDKSLRTHKHPTFIDSAAIVELLQKHAFQPAVDRLKGSWAILALRKDIDAMWVAVNYQALWWATTDTAIFFASARHFFPPQITPQHIPAYSTWCFRLGKNPFRLDSPRSPNKRAFVVASGGMDSTVAACAMRAQGYDIEMLHFQYGSRAQGPEEKAVRAVADYLGVPLHVFPMPIYREQDSPLLQAEAPGFTAEEEAEFAHEWVPARNLVMLSIATALAEARKIGTIALGNNIEESGNHADNTQHFIACFAEILPYATRDVDSQVRVVEPVGNLTKREIVALGHELQAPLHLTWSCYSPGPEPCGVCGSCHLRRIAHEMNGLQDPVMVETV